MVLKDVIKNYRERLIYQIDRARLNTPSHVVADLILSEIEMVIAPDIMKAGRVKMAEEIIDWCNARNDAAFKKFDMEERRTVLNELIDNFNFDESMSFNIFGKGKDD